MECDLLFPLEYTTGVAAHPAATKLRLLFKSRHSLWVVPARARKIAVMLVAVLFEAPPHMALNLVPAKGARSHDPSPLQRALPAWV